MKKILLALLFGLFPSESVALYPFPWIIQTEKGYVFNSAASFSAVLSKDSTITRAIQNKNGFKYYPQILLLSEDENKNKELKEIIAKCKNHGYKSIVVLRIKAQSDSAGLEIFNANLHPIDSVPKEFLTWRNWSPVTMDELKSSALQYRKIAEKRANGIFDPVEEPYESDQNNGSSLEGKGGKR